MPVQYRSSILYISDEAIWAKKIIAYFCFLLFSSDMRKIGSSRGAVTAYPRQLESLIRLAEAHAKMRFSSSVEIVDVEEAKR